MSVLAQWLIVGLIVGVLAWLFIPARAPIGIISTIIVCIVGAVIGGFILEALRIGYPTFGWRVIEGTIGAILLLFTYHAFAAYRRGI